MKLCVLYNQEEETVFVVKPTTLFKKIRVAIAKKYGIAEGSFRMNYNSSNCLDEHTPKMMEMEIGRSYRLDTYTEQVGGLVRCLNLTSDENTDASVRVPVNKKIELRGRGVEVCSCTMLLRTGMLLIR